MYHAGNLGFCLGFDWQTVASVAHGDHSVLQIASGCAVVDHVVHLGANPVVHAAHGTADGTQCAACVVGNLVLCENAALNLVIERCQRFDFGAKIRSVNRLELPHFSERENAFTRLAASKREQIESSSAALKEAPISKRFSESLTLCTPENERFPHRNRRLKASFVWS